MDSVCITEGMLNRIVADANRRGRGGEYTKEVIYMPAITASGCDTYCLVIDPQPSASDSY